MAFPGDQQVELTIDVARPAPAPTARLELDLDGQPLPVPLAGEGRLRVSIPPVASAPGKRTLSLRTNAFRMSDLGLSSDARELGVRVLAARLGPRSAAPSAAPDPQ
jgi:hypothetical protein